MDRESDSKNSLGQQNQSSLAQQHYQQQNYILGTQTRPNKVGARNLVSHEDQKLQIQTLNMKRISNTSQLESPIKNDSKALDIQNFIQMRSKMNNSEIKGRKSSQSVVMFNNNVAINNFKKSIPELKIFRRDQIITPEKAFGRPEEQQHLNQNSNDSKEDDDVMIELVLPESASPSPSSPQGSASEPRIRESNAAKNMILSNPSMTQSRTSIHEEPMMVGESESAMDRQVLSLSSLNMKSISAKETRQNSSQLSKKLINVQMIQGCSQQVLEEKAEHEEEPQQETAPGRSSAMESKSATLRLDKLMKVTETIKNDQNDVKSALVPPPEDIYRPKLTVKHDTVNFGLNMYFKKYHEFSTDPDQAGGDLAPNQQFLSQPWGINGCPPARQECLTDYVLKSLKDVVFSRYGMEYLKSFPRADDLCIGSYRINLDYLIFQKQRHLDTDNNASLVGMSFLKTKGQVAMNRQANSPDRRGSGFGALGQSSSMIIPFYKSVDQSEESLQFDSVFESGNLAIAIKVSEIEYNLLLQNDINTNGHTQWFYFKVKSNFAQNTMVTINLVNLYKAKSLYQMGLRVCYLDVTKAQKEGDLSQKKQQKQELPKWKRSEHPVTYIQNKFTNEQCPNGLFSVKFQFEFKAGEREIYFAHSMPYTYSMLTTYLNNNVSKDKAKRQILCHSLAGNKVEYLYITGKNKRVDAPQQQVAKDDFDEGHNSLRKNNLREEMSGANKTSHAFKRQKSLTKKDRKKIIEPKQIEKQVLILTSRVHPGETNASWMIQGLMDLLLNPSTREEEELVKNLRDHFEIYIIPMLNTDGVINGNYRCSLAACDLNRKYLKPSKVLHPAVYHTKKLCQTLQEQDKKQFFLYLDFHGHSAKKNIFQYGNRTDAWAPSRQKQYQMHHPSLFPLMLSKQFDYFNFNDCTFKMDKSKEATARVALFHKLRIPFVFTLEASFAGASKGSMAGKHFSQGDLMNVGKYVLKAIWEVKKLELNKTLLKQVNEEASKHAKISQADDTGDSDGCSSSEEDAELPTSSKKAMQIIKEEDSPGLKKKGELKSGNQAQQAPPKTGVAGARQPQNPNNRSIVNLKTIVVDNRNTGNQNSPRKIETGQMNKNQSDKTHVRRSIRHQNLQSQQMQEPPIGMNSQESHYLPSGGHYGEYTARQMRNQQPYRSEDSGPLCDLNSEINYQQQVLFEQFNAEIEKSFSEQQNHLDEIFKHTAKQFLDQNHQQKRNSRSQYKYQPFEIPSAGKNNNFFLEQFLVQHRKKNEFALDQQQPQQQVQTLIQLQKLHQMQKLNQMAQMQFFRQQADLLLSQNLSAQQQLELFQQFSYYQAQIQMQNQQYQMMLSNSIHGSNMNHLQNQRRATHQRFASQHANIPSYQRPQQRGSTVHPHILEPASVVGGGMNITSPTPPMPMFHDNHDDYYNNINQVVQQQSSTGTRFLGGRGSLHKGSVQMEVQQQDYQTANNPQLPQQNLQQQVVFGAQTPNAPNQDRAHQTMIKLKKGLVPPPDHHNQNFSQLLNSHVVDSNATGQQSLIYHNRFFQTRQANIASGRFKNMKDFNQTQQSHNPVYGLAKPSSQHFSRQDQKEANNQRHNTQINMGQHITQNTPHVESLDQVQNEARLIHQHYRTQNYNKKKEVRVGNFDHNNFTHPADVMVIPETQIQNKKEKYDQPLILDMRNNQVQPIQVNQQIFNIQLHPNQRFKMPLTDVNPGSLQSPQNANIVKASNPASSQSSQKFEVTIGKNKLNPVLQQNTLRTGNVGAYNDNATMRGEKLRNNQTNPNSTGDDSSKKSRGPVNLQSQFVNNMGILAELKEKTLGINKSQDENIMKKHQFYMEQQSQQIDHQPPIVLQTAPIAQGTRKTPSTFQNYPPERQQLGKTTTNHQLFIKTQREIIQGRRESANDESNLPIIQLQPTQQQQQNPSRYGQIIKQMNNNQQQQ